MLSYETPELTKPSSLLKCKLKEIILGGESRILTDVSSEMIAGNSC